MNAPFVEHLLELLRPLGRIQARPMFGGYGIYCDGVMFGLVSDDVFYLKTDEVNRPMFEARGLACFRYRKQGKLVRVAYYEAPAEALEDVDEMARWALPALEVARRAATQRQKR